MPGRRTCVCRGLDLAPPPWATNSHGERTSPGQKKENPTAAPASAASSAHLNAVPSHAAVARRLCADTACAASDAEAQGRHLW
eukprot:scaffold20639_cov90-Isochrysis_galbana.AAC.1